MGQNKLYFLGLSILLSCTEPSASLKDTIEGNLQRSSDQYKVMMKRLEPERFPKTYHAATDQLETSNSSWWCSGFYPGTLLNLFDQTRDSALLNEAVRMMKVLEKEKYNTYTHDLGFMMYCSFGKAYKLQPTDTTEEILLQSARSLATRFNPTVGCIKSWDSDSSDFLVIIDNMMNLELLFWATKASGDSSFYQIATTHANTTIANHFRPDNSSYHVLNYDPATGAVREKKTAQGYSDESAWARGQAWGLYGFTATYRETGDEAYLEQAVKIARFLLDHPNLPEDKVPYWDFNAPGIPNTPRDASAGAIMAAALLELALFVDEEQSEEFTMVAETILTTLSSEEYLAKKGENGGFILKHGVGHFPMSSEVDVPLTYADYYFVEAMIRWLRR